jgi:hypothetical protein
VPLGCWTRECTAGFQTVVFLVLCEAVHGSALTFDSNAAHKERRNNFVGAEASAICDLGEALPEIRRPKDRRPKPVPTGAHPAMFFKSLNLKETRCETASNLQPGRDFQIDRKRIVGSSARLQ